MALPACQLLLSGLSHVFGATLAAPHGGMLALVGSATSSVSWRRWSPAPGTAAACLVLARLRGRAAVNAEQQPVAAV